MSECSIRLVGKITTRPKRYYAQNGAEYILGTMKTERAGSWHWVHYTAEPCLVRYGDKAMIVGHIKEYCRYDPQGIPISNKRIIVHDIGRISRPKRETYRQRFKRLGLRALVDNAAPPPERGGSEGVI